MSNNNQVVWISSYVDANGNPPRESILDRYLKPRVYVSIIWASPYVNAEGYAGPPSIIDRYLKPDMSLYTGYKKRRHQEGRGREWSDALREDCANAARIRQQEEEKNSAEKSARYDKEAAECQQHHQDWIHQVWINQNMIER